MKYTRDSQSVDWCHFECDGSAVRLEGRIQRVFVEQHDGEPKAFAVDSTNEHIGLTASQAVEAIEQLSAELKTMRAAIVKQEDRDDG